MNSNIIDLVELVLSPNPNLINVIKKNE